MKCSSTFNILRYSNDFHNNIAQCKYFVILNTDNVLSIFGFQVQINPHGIYIMKYNNIIMTYNRYYLVLMQGRF